MKAKEKIQEAIRLAKESGNIKIAELLTGFMESNAPKERMPDIFKFCSNDEQFPSLRCVLHDHVDRVAVATNAHVLIVSKKHYREMEADSTLTCVHAGTLVSKSGEIPRNSRYPDYISVLPRVTSPLETITREQAEEALAQIAARKKEIQASGDSSLKRAVRRGGWASVQVAADVFVRPEVLSLMLLLPSWDWRRGSSQQLYYEDADYKAIAMCVLPPSKYKIDELVHYYIE